MLKEFYIFEPNNIVLPEYVYDQVESFAAKSLSSSDHYINKRKANIGRVKEQIIEGKIGEFAGRGYLVRELHLPGYVVPDLEILPVHKKSWAADLVYKDFGIHVKTVTKDSAEKYGESWVMQVDDPLFRNGLSVSDYMCFVLYDKQDKVFHVRALARWDWIYKNNIFKEMKLAKFKSNKVAIYYEDLVNAAV